MELFTVDKSVIIEKLYGKCSDTFGGSLMTVIF